jgi:hypothetical protein
VPAAQYRVAFWQITLTLRVQDHIFRFFPLNIGMTILLLPAPDKKQVQQTKEAIGEDKKN